jgi:hypothetical protein
VRVVLYSNMSGNTQMLDSSPVRGIASNVAMFSMLT